MSDAPGHGPRMLQLRPEYMTMALFVLALVVSASLSEFFADVRFVLESSSFFIEVGLIALALTFVVVAGEIDLSVAAMLALSACIFGEVFQVSESVALATSAALVSGLFMGLFNGVLVIWLQLPSLIVTIGTMTLFRGIAQILVGDYSIRGFPNWFVGIDWRTVGIVPVPVIIFFAAALVSGLILSRTGFGRKVYLIGANPSAAFHAGIRVRGVKLALFAATGVVSALAGIMMASRLGVVRYDLATGSELQAVLVVMLGGTYIFGGRGSILGTTVALWLLVVLQTGMSVANISIDYQLAVLGLLLILAIIGSNAIYARSGR